MSNHSYEAPVIKIVAFKVENGFSTADEGTVTDNGVVIPYPRLLRIGIGAMPSA